MLSGADFTWAILGDTQLRHADLSEANLRSAALALARFDRTSLSGTDMTHSIIRAKLALLAAAGLPNDAIAARLDSPRQIISKWRKRFFDQRLAGLEEEPRGGRTARFSPQRRH